MNRIIVDGLCKAFDAVQGNVLNGVNLELTPDITCLMGQSGAGKTTLARILAGLIAPDGGTLTWLGWPHLQNGKSGRVGYVFQEDRLLEWETALTNLLFVDTKKNQAHGMALLTQVGLADSINKKTAELSGGMKRRVALCRALMGSHDLLILDEPFKGLDDEIKQTVIKMVQTYSTENPECIILCITHDEDEVKQLNGRLVQLT